MAEDTSPETAPAQPADESLKEAAATATFVEDAETGKIEDAPTESAPSTIQMQPEDPPAEAPVTDAGNQPKAEQAVDPVVPPAQEASFVSGGAPKVSEINAEMNAGAARVQQHEERERLLAQKRAKEESGEASEAQQVSEATAANKDL